MILAMPVIQLLLFGYAINTDPRHLPTAVLVQEDSVFARSIVSALHNTGYFDIVRQARTPGRARRADAAAARSSSRSPSPATSPAGWSRGDSAQILVEADATDPTATGGAVAALAGLPQRRRCATI